MRRFGNQKTIIMALLLAVGLIAFTLQSARTAESKKILRIAFDAADIKSLDPGFSFGTMDLAHQDMIFDGLLRFKPGDISVVEPDIAERYDISEDGMEMTFYLRKGIMSHPFEGHPDGVEFTAEDVVFSIQKTADPKLSTYSGVYKNFIAEAIDKYTVRVKLQERIPNPERSFVDYRGGQMISKKGFETVGAARFKTKPVGTGPFRVERYVPGQKVVLAAHEKYWRGRPKLDGVEVWLMADVNSREFGLQRGELDVIEGVREQPWIEKMQKLPDIVVDVFGPGEEAFLNFNMSKKPFDNAQVRQALAYATSRDEIRTFIGPDASDPICAQIPPFLPGGLTCEEVAKAGLLYETDLEKAKSLLKEAGYADGFTIDETITERASYRRAIENLQAQWKRVGVTMNLNVVDHPTYHTLIRQDVNPVVLYIAMRPTADIWLTYFFHSNSSVVTGKNPITNFSHATLIDDLIEAAKNETDKEKQIQLWKQAQFTLLENAVSYPLYILKFVFARNPKIEWGYELNTTLALYPQINEQTDIK